MYRNLRNRSTIPALFAQTVRLHPDKPALIYEATGEVRTPLRLQMNATSAVTLIWISNRITEPIVRRIVVKNYCISIFILCQVWSFRELQERCHAVAHWALAQGWAEGDVVALYMESQPLVVALWLGLAMVGVEAALINHNLRQHSLLHCVGVSGARAMVFGTEMRKGRSMLYQ